MWRGEGERDLELLVDHIEALLIGQALHFTGLHAEAPVIQRRRHVTQQLGVPHQ